MPKVRPSVGAEYTYVPKTVHGQPAMTAAARASNRTATHRNTTTTTTEDSSQTAHDNNNILRLLFSNK